MSATALPFDPTVAPAEKGEAEMFSHLVESDLHKGELKRKGAFFLVTMAAYALMLMAAGVGGVLAYEAQIDDQNLVLVAMVPPEIEETKPKDNRPRPTVTSPRAAENPTGSRNAGGPAATTPSNTSTDLTKISGPARGSTTQDLPMPRGNGEGPGLVPGPYNPDGVFTDSESANRTGKERGEPIGEAPPLPVKKPVEKPRNTVKNIGVANSQALDLPQPLYPQLAKTAGIQGPVNVEIMIDEAGLVISARTVSGHPLLRQESERAAFRARFTPTLLSNQPVKAKGIITYNFVLRK
jgi:TonB family protein